MGVRAAQRCSRLKALLVVGHGATASDTPRALVIELRQLEGQRRARGIATPSPRELELDALVRRWPRTPQTDPYQAGLQAIVAAVRLRAPGLRVEGAFNEFCAPSVEAAIDTLVQEGVRELTLVPTMFTPGGVHSEWELPELVEAARARHAGVTLRYAWPFDLDAVAALLVAQAERA